MLGQLLLHESERHLPNARGTEGPQQLMQATVLPGPYWVTLVKQGVAPNHNGRQQEAQHTVREALQR